MMKIKFKKMSDNAIIPARGTEYSAGLDLYSTETCVIYPRDRKLIKTGIAMELPAGHYGMVVGRSGNTIKRGMVVATGIIDSDYTGEIGVMVFNETSQHMLITAGDRIGQIIVMQYPIVELCEVEELTKTERGEKGFGSTGK